MKLRGAQIAFHPNATQFTVNLEDPRVFGVWRQSIDRRQSIFALHNVSDQEITVPTNSVNMIEDENWVDLLSGETILASAETVTLAPYQCRWITNRS